MTKPGLPCAVLMLAALSAQALQQTAVADEIPDYIAAAVANPARPETDRQRDGGRRPAEVIAFAGIQPGDRIADFLPGRGYFTRILCKVVGDTGHVYAISVPRAAPPVAAPAADNQIATPPEACTNVSWSTLQSRNFPAPELYNASDDPGSVYEYYASRLPAESFVAPEPLDLIWTAENYHDLHNESLGAANEPPNMMWVNTALLKALKPGGLLIVEDHAAEAGSGLRDTRTLHRIDSAQAKREIMAAGFEFVDESSLLHRPDDARTAKAHDLHDRTDRFLLKFRRP